jgi:hypothetical protein
VRDAGSISYFPVKKSLFHVSSQGTSCAMRELRTDGDQMVAIGPSCLPAVRRSDRPRRCGLPGSAMRRDDDQVTRDGAQADPSLDAVLPVIETARQSMPSLQDTDASLTADAPAHPSSKPALTFVCPAGGGFRPRPRQHDASHAALGREPFVRGRGESAIGDCQIRRTAERRVCASSAGVQSVESAGRPSWIA